MKIMTDFRLILALGLVFLTGHELTAHDCSCEALAKAAQTVQSKSDFNLFNPVPENLMRDFDTDRPDRANSPHTLDAGHFQIESGLLGYARDTRTLDGTHSRGWTIGDTTLRIGLTNWAEVQLEVPFYETNRTTDPATHSTQRSEGIGDLSIALKTNLWGNDSGTTAGGLEFVLKTPTASHDLGNGKVEGAVLFLFATRAPGDFDVGFNTGAGISANDEGSGYHADIINAISVSHEIAGPLSAYVEFYSAVPTQHSREWIGSVDVGFLYMIGKNIQLDAGLNIGVTRGADDLEAFFGISVRL